MLEKAGFSTSFNLGNVLPCSDRFFLWENTWSPGDPGLMQGFSPGHFPLTCEDWPDSSRWFEPHDSLQGSTCLSMILSTYLSSFFSPLITPVRGTCTLYPPYSFLLTFKLSAYALKGSPPPNSSVYPSLAHPKAISDNFHYHLLWLQARSNNWTPRRNNNDNYYYYDLIFLSWVPGTFQALTQLLFYQSLHEGILCFTPISQGRRLGLREVMQIVQVHVVGKCRSQERNSGSRSKSMACCLSQGHCVHPGPLPTLC